MERMSSEKITQKFFENNIRYQFHFYDFLQLKHVLQNIKVSSTKKLMIIA